MLANRFCLLALALVSLAAVPSQASAAFSPVAVLSASDKNALVPKLDVAPTGHAAAAWQLPDAGDLELALRGPSGGFGAPTTIAAGTVERVEVAITDDGRAYVAWVDSGVVRYATKTASDALSAPVDLSNPAGAIADLAVDADSNGNVTFAWVRDGQAETRSLLSGALTAVQSLGDGARELDVASATGGIASIVLARHNGALGQDELVVRTRTAGSMAFDGTATELDFKTGPDLVFNTPSIDLAASDGSAYVAWQDIGDPGGEPTKIEGAARTGAPATGGFSGVDLLSDAGGEDKNPDVAVASSSEAVVAWSRDQRATAKLRSGGAFGAQLTLTTTQPGFDIAPSAAMSSAGKAAVAWDGVGTVHVAPRPAGGAFGAAETLASADSGGAVAGVGQDGLATVAWYRFVGGGRHQVEARSEEAPASEQPSTGTPPGLDPGTPNEPSKDPVPAQPVDDGRTSDGVAIPISATGRSLVVPDGNPVIKRRRAKMRRTDLRVRSMKSIVDEINELATAKLPYIGVEFRFVTFKPGELKDYAPAGMSKEDRNRLMDWLQQYGEHGDIVGMTDVGETLRSTLASPAKIQIAYYDPLKDPVRQQRLEREAKELEKKREAEVKAEMARIESEKRLKAAKERERMLEQRRKQCNVLTWTQQERENIFLAYRYYGNGPYPGLEQVMLNAGCSPKTHYDTIFKDQKGIVDPFVKDVSYREKEDVIVFEVATPVKPDLAIIFREEPTELKHEDDLSFADDWTLPRSDYNRAIVTLQVVEIATGRLVSGAEVQVYSSLRDGALLSKPVKTDSNGDVTFHINPTHEERFEFHATVTGSGLTSMGWRTLQIRNHAKTVRTAAGRTLVQEKGRYNGTQADLNAVKGLKLTPGNLGTGVGQATTNVPVVQQAPVYRFQSNGGVVLGMHNAVPILGANTIVASGPGVIATGGGNLIGQAGGNRFARSSAAGPGAQASLNLGGLALQAWGWLVQNLQRSTKGNVGNAAAQLSQTEKQKLDGTVDAAKKQGVSTAPQSQLKPEGIGINSASAGNVISVGGGNVISTGGGNVIATGGGNLISDKGLGVISTGGGNAVNMPVGGGRVISTGGGN